MVIEEQNNKIKTIATDKTKVSDNKIKDVIDTVINDKKYETIRRF